MLGLTRLLLTGARGSVRHYSSNEVSQERATDSVPGCGCCSVDRVHRTGQHGGSYGQQPDQQGAQAGGV